MKQTGRLASFYIPIRDEKDAERVLSDLSIFWYAFGIILIIILLLVAMLTKEEVSLLFSLALVSAGYLLSRRKSRVLSSFILVYSLALIGFAIWVVSGSTSADFMRGLSSDSYNSHLIAAILFFSSYSLIILLLALCSWAAFRGVIATFVYHKKIGSQIFGRNILIVCGVAVVSLFLAPMIYLFSEMPWQHKNYVDIYKYFAEELVVCTVPALIAIILLIILTKYFPLVRWTTTDAQNTIQKRLASLYTPILNEEDAARVLSDLSILWYVSAIVYGVIAVGYIISKGQLTIPPIVVYLLAGYYLPRRKSRALSIVVLLYTIYVAAVAVWRFLYLHPPSFSLFLLKNIITLIVLLIPVLAVSCAWAAYRSTLATFIYHRHYSQLKENASSGGSSDKLGSARMTEVIKARKWWLAGLLSLIGPGLGQIYNGQIKKAVLLYSSALLVLFLIPLYVLLNYISITLIISSLIVIITYYVGVIADAILVAKKVNATYTLKKFNKWYVYILVFLVINVISSCIFFYIRHSYIQALSFPSSSMEPTILEGDHVLIDKRFSARHAQLGDLIIFLYPDDEAKYFLKRVVAVAGDKVEIRDKKLFINDKLQNEPYAIHTDDSIIPGSIQPRDDFGPITVSPDCIFVMGDNRDNSYDSRFWGVLGKSKVKGKLLGIYWSWNKAKRHVRWERIGLRMQ